MRRENLEIPTGSEAILVVDDIEDMAKMAAEILGRLGYAVTATSDPKEAMSILRTPGRVFQLLLTDLAMPGIDGLELAAYARANCEQMKILAVSGYSEKLNDAKMPDLFDGFVTKPYRRAELALKLRSTLDSDEIF